MKIFFGSQRDKEKPTPKQNKLWVGAFFRKKLCECNTKKEERKLYLRRGY